MASSLAFLIHAVVGSSMIPSGAATSSDVFLGSRGQLVSAAGIHGFSDLLEEIESVVGSEHRQATESRAGRLEDAMRPMYAAMPKNPSGLLDSAAVRYLLHRLFVQRHGWFVTGLDNGGDAWNSSSPAAVFKDHSGDHHTLFSNRLDSHGFSLHQVAVFAATLETLVHGENLERLVAAYRVLGLSSSESLSENEAAEAIEAYMLMFVQVTNLTSVTARQFKSMKSQAKDLYQTWPDTVKFVHGIQQRVLADTEDDDRRTWDTNLKVVEEVGERYGRWQDKECHVLKDMLVNMEKAGTGRVRLEDFYAPGLHNSSWQFVESVPYLRQLGALDETDPQQMSVIIPNYLNSPANCVASSKFYSVCCIDQCEELLGSLEVSLASPDATPSRIVELVSALPSDTVQAPRSLSSLLLQRLDDIAAHHGGQVPLHGRLFAQWLHHAYPRECPFPHVSGTTKPVTQEEWLERSSEPIEAGKEDIRKILESKLDKQADTGADNELPWVHEEELFVHHHGLLESEQVGSTGGRIIKLVAGFVCAAAVFSLRLSLPEKRKAAHCSDHKYYV